MKELTKYYLAKGFGYTAPFPKEKPIYEELPLHYFSNDENLRWAVTLMVCDYIPKRDSKGQLTNDGKLTKNRELYSRLAEIIWKQLIASNESFVFKEVVKGGNPQTYFDGSKLVVEIYAEVEKDYEDLRTNESESRTPNIGLNLHEFIHIYQFLHGRIWFTNTGGPLWKAEQDIYDEAEAYKKAAHEYCPQAYVYQQSNLSNVKVGSPTLNYWYKQYASLDQIVEQLKSGITLSLEHKRVFDQIDANGVEKEGEELENLEITYKKADIYQRLGNVNTIVPSDITSPTHTKDIFAYPYKDYEK